MADEIELLIAMKKSVQLQCMCLSCDACDIGSQRCRVGPLTFQRLPLEIGDFAQINFGVDDGGNEVGRSIICKIFLRRDNADDFMNVDKTVYSGKAVNSSQHCNKCLISIIPKQIRKIACLDIIIVTSKDSLVNKLKTNLGNLKIHVRELLEGFGVNDGYSVNCESIKAAATLGITTVKVVGATDLNPDQIAIVTSKTSINIIEIISQERFNQANKLASSHKLAGLEHAERHLKEALLPLLFPKAAATLGLEKVTGTLIIGDSGTGKSALVYRIANDCNAEVVQLSGSDLCDPHPGESEKHLRNIFARAAKISEDAFCILFLDKVESIGGRRNQGNSSSSTRLLAQLLTLLDGVKSYNKLVVLGATSNPSGLDPALRRPGRFDREIILGLPNKQERLQILTNITASFPLNDDVNLQNVAECTGGYSGADLALLCQQVAVQSIRLNQQKIPHSTFYSVICNFRPSTQRGCRYTTGDLQPVKWNDIGGLDNVKQQLKQMIGLPLTNPTVLQRLGLPYPKGVLLYGPPGCCKTTLVRAAATDVSLPFFSIGPAQIYSPYVGDSEKAITEVFQKARSVAPCILFLDEIDSLVGNRSSQHYRGVHEKILSALLNEMDGIGIRLDEQKTPKNLQLQHEEDPNEAVSQAQQRLHIDNTKVFVVAATNRPDLIDEALLRPGRFDRILYIPPPDYDERCSILQSLSKKIPMEAVDIPALARQTDYFSGADLENLCREAAMLAIREDGTEVTSLQQHHLEDSLNQLQPSLSKKQLDFYENLKLQF